jgi:hypothetical protein
MALSYVNASPSLSISELRLLIQQQEELRGPLRDIGNNGYSTVLAFDPNEEPPSNPPALELALEGQPKPQRIISEGRGFVDGRRRDLVVYRSE